MKIEEKLNAMGYTLPVPFVFPKPNRRGCVQVGNILYVSGHSASKEAEQSGVRCFGRIGENLSEEEGYAAARAAVLSILASVKAEIGDLDRVQQVIRLFGMCNVTPDFKFMPRVIDGASDFLYELFGPQAGCHARSAVGMASLPHGIAVEINAEFAIT